jgi:hypothetical protein
MPTTPYVKILASVNGGANQSGGITIVDGDTVDLTLEDTTGITYCLWEIWDYPTGMSTPSGWTADATAERFYYAGISPPQLDFTGVPWGKFLLRATGNNGIKNGASYVLPADGTTMRDESTALRILSGSGFDDIASGETTQFYSVDAWIGSYKANLRLFSVGLLPAGSATGQAAQWNNSSSAWEIATGILFGTGHIDIGGNAPTTAGLNLSNGNGIQGKDAVGTERLLAKIDPSTGNVKLGMADGSKALDCQGNALFNDARNLFSIATDSDHTLDYANGDYQVLPSGVLSNDRDFTLPTGVADGLRFTFMSLENSYAVTLLGASKPAGGSDPVVVYTTGTPQCITFRRIDGAWQAESSAQWTW